MSSHAVLEDGLAWLDGLDQESLAVAALLVGAALVARGFVVAKLVIITSMGFAFGRLAYIHCVTASQPVAFLASLAVAVFSFDMFHRVFPLLVFFIGAIAGGATVFAIHASLNLGNTPAALLGLTILSSVFGGLLFKHFRDIGWRILTPMLGSFLVAVAVRYLVTEMSEIGEAKVSDARADLRDPQGAFTKPVTIMFAVSWGVCTSLGWYFQLATFFGDEDHLALPDAWLERVDALLYRFPQLADCQQSRDLNKLYSISSAGSSDPLLSRVTSSAVLRSQTADYRPEAAVILAVISVLILNYFLASQPLMLIGHVMFMSSAFLPFITAGLVSYASPDGMLPGIFGPQSGGPLQRHFTHASFNSLALVSAVLGYVCIYRSHQSLGMSQLGFDAGNTWDRVVHVWNGYLILALMLIQCGSGLTKLIRRSTSNKPTAAWHGVLGRWIYGLAAVNQLLGYFFKGFMPVWGSILLSTMLAAIASATLFFLNAKSQPGVDGVHLLSPATIPVALPTAGRAKEFAVSYTSVTQRLDSLRTGGHHRSVSIATTGSDRDGSLLSREGSGNYEMRMQKWEAVLDLIEKNDTTHLLKTCFSDWHRFVQSERLAKTSAALEGAENIVEFLSAAMVNDRNQEP